MKHGTTHCPVTRKVAMFNVPLPVKYKEHEQPMNDRRTLGKSAFPAGCEIGHVALPAPLQKLQS